MSGNQRNYSLFYSTHTALNKVLKLPKVNKSILRHSFQYLGPKYLNSPPTETKNTNLLKVFYKNQFYGFSP